LLVGGRLGAERPEGRAHRGFFVSEVVFFHRLGDLLHHQLVEVGSLIFHAISLDSVEDLHVGLRGHVLQHVELSSRIVEAEEDLRVLIVAVDVSQVLESFLHHTLSHDSSFEILMVGTELVNVKLHVVEAVAAAAGANLSFIFIVLHIAEHALERELEVLAP